MAVARLGAIVTGLAGSIGGTTIRRIAGGISIYNRPMNSSLSQVQQNVNLVNLAGLSREYTTMPAPQKEAWRVFARGFTFPNRFGEQRQISGKSMWMKCNGSLLHFEEFVEIPDGLSINVPFIEITGLNSDFNASNLVCVVASEVGDARFFIRVAKLRFPGQQIIFTRQKVLASGFIIGATGVDLWAPIELQFGRINIGDEYSIAVYGVAEVGFPLLMMVRNIVIS